MRQSDLKTMFNARWQQKISVVESHYARQLEERLAYESEYGDDAPYVPAYKRKVENAVQQPPVWDPRIEVEDSDTKEVLVYPRERLASPNDFPGYRATSMATKPSGIAPLKPIPMSPIIDKLLQAEVEAEG